MKLDLILVKPGNRRRTYGRLGDSLSGVTPPLDIGLLASFVREKGYSVRIIDAEAEGWGSEQTAEEILRAGPKLVGIFAHTVRMDSAGEILRILKRYVPEIRTVLGGRHPSALPERTLKEEEVDFVIYGEAFYPLLKLLEGSTFGEGIWCKVNGKILSSGRAQLLEDLDRLPPLAWDLFPLEKYRAHNWHCFEDLTQRSPYGILYTSLGCPFGCSYCCVNAVYGKPTIRYRSPQKVIEELDILVKKYGVKNIRIVDDIFTLGKDRVMQICNLIISKGYRLNMWCYGRVDMVDLEMLMRMKEAGINWIAYGIESASEQIRKGVSKKMEQEVIYRAVELTRKAGIYIIGNFIFGLPDDNFETMRETLKMAKKFNFEYVNFYVTMAWPGSKLYEDAIKNGIRLPKSWSGYAQLSEEALPLPTKYLCAEEVLRFRDSAFEEYFTNPEYLSSIKEKFGEVVLKHIEEMLKYKIRRRFI